MRTAFSILQSTFPQRFLYSCSTFNHISGAFDSTSVQLKVRFVFNRSSPGVPHLKTFDRLIKYASHITSRIYARLLYVPSKIC